ncbi:MAG: ABC transporter permease, partial [Leptospiraceae bacterium]|nr:ABC transporter permease [Leptospiraceae bacterium]
MILFLNSLLLALRAIRRNVLRSSLTVLGVVIGVSAVITMVNVGKAATLQVQDQISSMGSNLLIVRPGKRSFGGPRMSAPNFREEDMEAIMREATAVERLAPNASTSAMAVYGNENLTTMVTGTNNDYLTVGNWDLATGRSFSAAEIRGGRPVCIIGNTVRTTLFGQSDPVGAVLRLKNVSCTVIGLLASKGESMRGDQDSIILVPLRMYWRRLSGNRDIDMIQVSAKSQGLTTLAKNQIEEILRRKRRILRGQEDNFSVRDMQEIADALAGTTRVLTALLSAIAAVSLLVGGIGIMNIMLVSVTERTREIGIRLA